MDKKRFKQSVLKELMKEMSEEAKKVREDYKKNPSEGSGSVYQINETSPYLDNKFTGESWKKVIFTSDMGMLLKDIKKHNEGVKKKGLDKKEKK